MLRSYTLFRAFGIPIRVHGSMLLFLPLLAMTTGDFLFGLILLVAVFGCVLLHELGHALAALYYKIPVRQITLYPIGGVAGLADMPSSPKKEFVITVAGPLVNFILAPLFFVTFVLFGGVSDGVAGLLFNLALLNVILGVFNLLPGFPMDGGRILRAILAMRMPYLKATQIAVRVGQYTAAFLFVWGLASLFGVTIFGFGSPMMMFIAAFVYFAAKAELMQATLREAQRTGGASLFGQFFGGQGPTPSPSQAPKPPAEGETFVINRSPESQSERSQPQQGRVVIEILPDGSVRRR